jgi:DNA-binding transcriptional regulator LsrR (DeoR family)
MSVEPIDQQLLLCFEHFVEGLSYEALAEKHKLSVATVSRRITEAQKKGYLRPRHTLVPPVEHREELFARVRHLRVESRVLEILRNRHATNLRQVTVCTGDLNPEREVPDSAANDYQRLSRVALHAAYRLQYHVHELDKERPRDSSGRPQYRLRIGINWGWTMVTLSRYFKELADARIRRMTNVTVSGLTGIFWPDSEKEPDYAYKSWETSSSSCAQNIHESLAFENLPQVTNYIHRVRVPTLLTRELVAGERLGVSTISDALQQFFLSDPGYRSVHGRKPVYPTAEQAAQFCGDRHRALAHLLERYPDRIYNKAEEDAFESSYGNIARYDLLVTGLSALTKDSAIMNVLPPREREKLETSYIPDEKLRGDLATHLFTEDGVFKRRTNDSDEGSAELNSRVVGLWPEDLKEVADRHRERPFGGVLVACAGHEKAEPLLVATTKMDIANEICIDTNLAWKLLVLAEEDQDKLAKDFGSLTALRA